MITGASKGLGLAFCNEFASHGFDLIVTARDLPVLSAEAEKIAETYGVKVFIYAADLAAPGGAEELFARVKKDGHTVSVLINNAGTGTCGESRSIPVSSDVGMINLNITAATVLSKLFAGEFAKNCCGAICNVCSVGAFQPGPYTASYYASKSYLYNYTLALRTELKEYGVAVTALCPGSVGTDFFKTANAPEPEKPVNPQTVAAYGYRSLMKNNKTAIYPFKNRLALIAPKSIRSAYIAKLKRQDHGPK